MEGLHAFSTGLQILFSLFLLGFILFVAYTIFALNNKKYNNVISLSLMCLFLLPPVIGNIDDLGRILFKIIALIPFILLFIIINIIISIKIRNSKQISIFRFNKKYSDLYKIFFGLVIIFNITSIFSQVLCHINFTIYYCSFHILYNIYSHIVLSLLLLYLLNFNDEGVINRLLFKIAMIIFIFDMVYYIFNYIFRIDNEMITNTFFIAENLMKVIVIGVIFVKNIEINIFKSAKLYNFSKSIVFIVYVVINFVYIIGNFSLFFDTILH